MKFDYYKKKTYTEYWNNFSTKPKKCFSISNFFKKLKKLIHNILGFKVSIKIHKNKKQKNETYLSYVTNENIKKNRNNLLKNEIISFLNSSDLSFDELKIENYLNEFEIVYKKSPVKDQDSGFGFNESIFFYTLLKIINPSVVIESGIMRGFTTYLIDAATNDNCKIYCYDINFENKTYNSKKATYFNSDISLNTPELKDEKIVALWDDHTSQMDRLKFSINNNIKYNFFDDDLSFLNIHADGWPPIPTISMLMDIKNHNLVFDEFSWISRNRIGTAYVKNWENINEVQNIKFHKIFPQLFPITGYQNHSQCSLVINDLSR